MAILLGLAGQIASAYPHLLTIRQNAEFVVIGFSVDLLPIATIGNGESPAPDSAESELTNSGK